MPNPSRTSLTATALAVGLLLFATACQHRPARGHGSRDLHQPSKPVTLARSTVFGPQWRVEKVTLRGGKQEGVELINIDNGSIIITVIPTRGLSILDVRDSKTGDRLLGWDSPVHEVVHPSYVDLESRGGLGWLEGFNEWLVRCGLAFAGHPGTDEFTTNTGDTATMDLTLHGKIGNIPASSVQVVVDEKPPHRIRVTGVVQESMFYGPNLQLVAQVSTEPGSDSFRINDTIANFGAFDQEFQLIYHANFGPPMLEQGATVVTASKQVTPMNAHAAKAVNNHATYAGPTKGFIEEVYLHEPYSTAADQSMAVLRNASGDRGTSVRWSTAELPYLTVWKNTAATEDGYVTGIEPATGYPFNRKVERKFGRVPKLAPGASRTFTLDFAVLRDKAAVDWATGEVNGISAGRPTTLNDEPPEIGD